LSSNGKGDRMPPGRQRRFSISSIVIEPVTLQQGALARQAYYDFGRGKHRARLNFGDCFAYALAKAMDEPLLFKGRHFVHTDVRVARAGTVS